jgi:hypothetical protein
VFCVLLKIGFHEYFALFELLVYEQENVWRQIRKLF